MKTYLIIHFMALVNWLTIITKIFPMWSFTLLPTHTLEYNIFGEHFGCEFYKT